MQRLATSYRIMEKKGKMGEKTKLWPFKKVKNNPLARERGLQISWTSFRQKILFNLAHWTSNITGLSLFWINLNEWNAKHLPLLKLLEILSLESSWGANTGVSVAVNLLILTIGREVNEMAALYGEHNVMVQHGTQQHYKHASKQCSEDFRRVHSPMCALLHSSTEQQNKQGHWESTSNTSLWAT